jgi:hypothetical protein
MGQRTSPVRAHSLLARPRDKRGHGWGAVVEDTAADRPRVRGHVGPLHPGRRHVHWQCSNCGAVSAFPLHVEPSHTAKAGFEGADVQAIDKQS